MHRDPDGKMASPWCAFELPHLGSDARRELAGVFLAKNECCLDAMSVKLRERFPTVDELASEKTCSMLQRSAAMAHSTTLVTETKHARRRAYRENRHNIRKHSHSCAHYVVREAARIH